VISSRPPTGVRPALVLLLALAAGCSGGAAPPRRAGRVTPVLRLAYFPNVTHAQAVLGRARGEFARTIGARVEWTQFNAGPSAVEALFAGAVDAAYIGPNPAINGHLKSHGASFAVVAGAASGGAALLVRADAGIRRDGDFHGRTVATPQLGNTQDVAARIWFKAHGYRLAETGGDLTLLPIANPEQLLLFRTGAIDAAWTVEPWVSLLELEAGARVYLEERSLWPGGRYATAVLVVRRAYLHDHADVVEQLLAAHVDGTLALRAGGAALAEAIAEEIARETHAAVSPRVVRAALSRLEFTWDPLPAALTKAADDAHRVGFLAGRPVIGEMLDLGLLNRVLAQRGLLPLAAVAVARGEQQP